MSLKLAPLHTKDQRKNDLLIIADGIWDMNYSDNLDDNIPDNPTDVMVGAVDDSDEDGGSIDAGMEGGTDT